MDEWQAGDRFQLQPVNCGLDKSEGLVFELTKRGRQRGRGTTTGGWYFHAPHFDASPDSRWYALSKLNADLVSGKVVRLPRAREASTSVGAVDPHVGETPA
jgi:hypothetical protein